MAMRFLGEGACHFSRPWGVVDPMTAQQVVGIIAEGVRHFPPLSLVRDAWYLGVLNMRENKPNLGSDCRIPALKTSVKQSGSKK